MPERAARSPRAHHPPRLTLPRGYSNKQLTTTLLAYSLQTDAPPHFVVSWEPPC